jgi:hypothetical protein
MSEMKEKIWALKKKGYGLSQAAKELGVSSGSLSYWWYREPKRKQMKKQNEGGKQNVSKGNPVEEGHIAYAFGHTEAWLEIYSKTVGIPVTVLAGRVADLLRNKARREILGS